MVTPPSPWAACSSASQPFPFPLLSSSSKPPLARLEAISSCPVVAWEKRLIPTLLQPSLSGCRAMRSPLRLPLSELNSRRSPAPAAHCRTSRSSRPKGALGPRPPRQQGRRPRPQSAAAGAHPALCCPPAAPGGASQPPPGPRPQLAGRRRVAAAGMSQRRCVSRAAHRSSCSARTRSLAEEPTPTPSRWH